MNNEIKRNNIEEGHYIENEYPFTIKPNFSTLGEIIESSPEGPIISFVYDNSIRSLLGFRETILYKNSNPSTNRADIRSFDNVFLEINSAQGMILKVRDPEYFIILL